MGEPFNRDGQVYPANQPGVGTQYDPHAPAKPAPVLAPEVVVTPSTPGTVVQPDRHGYTGYTGPVGPGHYADGEPIGATGVTGATGESFLQHLEDEIKTHL